MDKKKIIISVISGLWEGLELTSAILWRAILGFGMLALLRTLWQIPEGWLFPTAIIIFSITPLINRMKHNFRFLKGE